MQAREIEENVIEYLNLCGLRQVGKIRRSKHTTVEWVQDGIKRAVTFPSSPSDHRTLQNTMAQVRRMLKTTGTLFTTPQNKTLTLTMNKTQARELGWKENDRFDYGGGLPGIHLRRNPAGVCKVQLSGQRLHFIMALGKLEGITAMKTKATAVPLETRAGSLMVKPPAEMAKIERPEKDPPHMNGEDATPEPRTFLSLMNDLLSLCRQMQATEVAMRQHYPNFECRYAKGKLKATLDIDG